MNAGNKNPRRSSGLVIGKIVGAPIVLTPSWFIAALVLTAVFAPNVTRVAPYLALPGVIGVAFGFAVLLAVSVFLHETAHALVAAAQGQKVTELAVTLWGGHTAFSNQAKGPAAAAAVAVVGPITNLALAGLFFGFYQITPHGSIWALLCYAAFFSNGFVGLFNLLPGLPLDGGQILESIVWGVTGWRTRGTLVAGWFGRIVAIGVVAWAIAWPLIQGQSPNLTSALWMVMIAAFLWQGAGQAITLAKRREEISTLSARTISARIFPLLISSTVAEAQDAAASHSGEMLVVVDEAAKPVGWINMEALGAVAGRIARRTPVASVLVPFAQGSEVPVNIAGLAFLTHIDATSSGARIVPVIDDDGALVGAIDINELATELKARRAKK
jgi:Zn-dependent protease